MILEALVRYYEKLAEDEKVSKPGWCTAKISYVLELAKMESCEELFRLNRKKNVGKRRCRFLCRRRFLRWLLVLPESVRIFFAITLSICLELIRTEAEKSTGMFSGV